MAPPSHRPRLDKHFPWGIDRGRGNTLKFGNYARAFIPASRTPSVVVDLPCPTCGSPLTFLEQYQRYYCHRCFQYAPEGYGDHGAQTCPTCGGILSYVRQYGRMYCYRCNAYPPETTATRVPVEPAAEPKPGVSVEEKPAATPTPAAAEAGAATVLVATPAPSAPTPEPAAEAKPEPEEIRAEETATAPAPAPVTEPATTPTEAPPQKPPEPSHEMRALAAQKPAAVRVKLFSLKKAELTDLALVYGVDSSGAKEELQQRLLGYLHDLELGGAAVPAATAAKPEPAAAVSAHEPAPSEAPTEPQPAPVAAASPAPVVSEEEPGETAAAEPAPILVVPAPAAAGPVRAAPKVEHPCPTCGRELTFISQYGRFYCYSCQRYAPAATRSRNACPTCGATMRWIEPHRRWWCDSCAKYASADLPPPSGAASTAAATPVAETHARAIIVHHHGSPASGAGLVGFGLALYIVYAFFAFLGGMLGFAPPTGITPEMLDLLQFFAFLLVAVGAIVGVYGVRGRD